MHKTKKEREFVNKVCNFMSKNNVSIGFIALSKEVNYTNTNKLKEYLFEERGTISLSLAGKIEDFIDKKERK